MGSFCTNQLDNGGLGVNAGTSGFLGTTKNMKKTTRGCNKRFNLASLLPLEQDGTTFTYLNGLEMCRFRNMCRFDNRKFGQYLKKSLVC